MKRSEVNKALRELEAMCEKYCCYLPPFCHFTPEEWKTKGHEYDEVRDCCLGWDITDYGQGNFDKVGFSLITIRNGSQTMREKYPKVYAEKLLFLMLAPYKKTLNWLVKSMFFKVQTRYEVKTTEYGWSKRTLMYKNQRPFSIPK